MANHSITIAKASFAAACLRPDVIQTSREDIAHFHSVFEAALSKCSPANVQRCKDWLIGNVVPSTHRTVALGKYLVSRANDAGSNGAHTPKATTISPAVRQRLHILYIVNDLFHHAKYHSTNPDLQSNLSECMSASLLGLFEVARLEKRKNVGLRLQALLRIWEDEQYISNENLMQLKASVLDNRAGVHTVTTVSETAVPPKGTAYVMPPTHGDPTTPYYDLPAANLMPHIVPNKPIPMRPDHIRALQLSSGPADESLINAVKDFLQDVERMQNPYEQFDSEGLVVEVDELGQQSYRNEADEMVCDAYYGWSREFCDKMKRRGHEDNRSHSRNRSRSHSSRVSSSSSRSRSRSYGRDSPKRRRHNASRSLSPLRRQRYRGHSRLRSPDRVSQQDHHSLLSQDLVPAMPPSSVQNMPYPPPPLNVNDLTIPPPRPPNYSGPWPPPLPPQPLRHGGFSGVPFPPPLSSFHGTPNASAPANHQGRRH